MGTVTRPAVIKAALTAGRTKLHAATEALPAVLDHASAEGL